MEMPTEAKTGTEMGIRENMMVVVVVEYLGDSMSKDLLGKFPDYSDLDFDYSQSSLWSPLRKLAYRNEEDGDVEGEDEGLLLVHALQKATVDLKKKIATGTHAFSDKIRILKQRRKKKKKAAFDFSPAPVSSPTPRKGWNKLLKVASRQFKKATKKKEPPSHKRLSYPIV